MKIKDEDEENFNAESQIDKEDKAHPFVAAAVTQLAKEPEPVKKPASKKEDKTQ